MEINKQEPYTAPTSAREVLERKKTSTYYRHKRLKRERIKKAKRKYGAMILLLLIVPSVFIGYFSRQLTKEQEAVQRGILTDTAKLEAIQAENEALRQEAALLATYDDILGQLGAMGEQIRLASLEFGQDAQEAVKLQGLMIGIANAESSLGKNYAVDYDANCHNWWGLKGGRTAEREDGSYLRCFYSDEAGARTMAKTLKLYYLNEGKDTPEKIVAKYVGATWGQYHDTWVNNVKKYAK